MFVGCGANNSGTDTPRATAILRRVVIVVFPLIAFDSPTREMPILSAKSVCVIPFSLRISAILNSLSIDVNILFCFANIQIKHIVNKYYSFDNKLAQDIIYRAVTWLIMCNIISKSIPVPTVPIIRITLAPVPQTAMIARGSATMDFIAMAMNV